VCHRKAVSLSVGPPAERPGAPHCWAPGSYLSPGGRDAASIREDIPQPEAEDRRLVHCPCVRRSATCRWRQVCQPL